jgi:hypothetical protein
VYLGAYAKLSPFGNEKNIALQESTLPHKTITYIQTHSFEYESNSKDSITEFDLLNEFQVLIIQNIESLIAHQRFNENRIEEVLMQDLDLHIAVSSDRKLFNFSLSEKTGGTYQSQISIMHYTDLLIDKTANPKEFNSGERSNPYSVFEGDGFGEIFLISTNSGPKYVLTGFVRGCSYCFETNIMLVSYTDEGFKQDFYYSVNSRSWEGGVSYDAKTKTITADYTTDDLTTDCDCIQDTEEEVGLIISNAKPEEAEPEEQKCYCTFKFNGVNFELIGETAKDVGE